MEGSHSTRTPVTVPMESYYGVWRLEETLELVLTLGGFRHFRSDLGTESQRTSRCWLVLMWRKALTLITGETTGCRRDPVSITSFA